MLGKVRLGGLVTVGVGSALILAVSMVPAEASTAYHYSTNYRSSAKYYTGGVLKMCDRQLDDGWGPVVKLDGNKHNSAIHAGDGHFTGNGVEKCWKSDLRGDHLGSKVRIRVGNYDIRSGSSYSYGAWSGWAKG